MVHQRGVNSIRYLLDTNIISEALVPHPDPRVVEKLALVQPESATAAPVWHELLYGCLRLDASPRRDRLYRYLHDVVATTLPIVAYDEPVAARHAAERARLAREGRTPSFVDGQIAAIAQVHGLVLVTRNVSDFELFEDLAVENWFDAG